MQPYGQETTRFIKIWMELRQVIQAANFNRFQQAGLSATQFMTLNVIPKEGMTLSELAIWPLEERASQKGKSEGNLIYLQGTREHGAT